jgi:hypothetical protein
MTANKLRDESGDMQNAVPSDMLKSDIYGYKLSRYLPVQRVIAVEIGVVTIR